MKGIVETDDAEAAGNGRRLCFVVTVGSSLQSLCRGRFEYFQELGYDVTAVCAPTPEASDIRARGVALHTAPLTRSVSPFADLRAVWNLYRFFRRNRFDLVEVSTPKAALIGSIASRLARVPCLLHLLRGLSYQQQRGVGGRLLIWSFRVACRLPHHLISISHFMMNQAVRDGMCKAEDIKVLGDGSSNGIDLDRFRPRDPDKGRALRDAFGLPHDALVVGFVGRFTGDKGIRELLTAYGRLRTIYPSLCLLMVGELEARDRPEPHYVDMMENDERIVLTGWQADTSPFYHAMDVFTLPTHREGFGTVLLEAAACALPIVTTNETGWWHPNEEESSGLFVPIKDADELQRAVAALLDDEALRTRLGQAARARVERSYDCRQVWAMQAREFATLIRKSETTARRGKEH